MLYSVFQNKFDSYLASPDSLSLPQSGLLLGTLVRSVHSRSQLSLQNVITVVVCDSDSFQCVHASNADTYQSLQQSCHKINKGKNSAQQNNRHNNKDLNCLQ